MTDPLETLLGETASIRADMELQREKYARIFLMGAPMGFAATCAIAAMHTDHGTFPWPIVSIVTLFIVVIGFQIANALYRKKTKAAFLERIAASLGLEYHRRGFFTPDSVRHHKILPPSDSEHVEDGFSGTINGVSVMFEEMRLTDHVQSDKNETREIDVFWGVVIRIGIGKKLEAHTVVLPRNALQTFFRTAFSKFEPVKLVSPKFEAQFDVMSTSQVEARYVLDPAFMERFMEAGRLLGAKWTEASFQGNEIVFAVQRNKPMFEIGWLFKPLTEQSLQHVADELKVVIGLIDALKLNPHTGLGAPLPGRE